MGRRTEEELEMLRDFGFHETADAFEFSHLILEKLKVHFVHCGRPSVDVSVLAAGSVGKLMAGSKSDIECYGLIDERESLRTANEAMLRFHRYLDNHNLPIERAQIDGADPLGRPLEGFQWNVWHTKRFMRTNTTRPHLEAMFKENLANIIFMSQPIFNEALAGRQILTILEYHRTKGRGDVLRMLYALLMRRPFARDPDVLQRLKLARDVMINTISGIHLALFPCASIGGFEAPALRVRKAAKRLPKYLRDPFRRVCVTGLDSYFKLRVDIEEGHLGSASYRQHKNEFDGAWRTIRDINYDLAIRRGWHDLV